MAGALAVAVDGRFSGRGRAGKAQGRAGARGARAGVQGGGR